MSDSSKMCELIRTKNTGRNWIKSADKIAENHADFIIVVVLLNPGELV